MGAENFGILVLFWTGASVVFTGGLAIMALVRGDLGSTFANAALAAVNVVAYIVTSGRINNA